ncbi:hypothetical protein KW842_04420 [Duganella sp. sic0402]|uniref:hypothetical protein n=1 Tax=Duganella sp. sic0402 TaxID=2854786 RepID=UPI001C459D01|nr:hypothetical protein [Duganella sp. sic0402]MBV7535010.1 hypothetical protein [Duganella sp. sic0402]
MALKTAMALVAGILLAGCASRYTPTPLAANFPTTKQAKLQAAHHWGVISDNISRRVALELRKSPPRPVYIAEPKDPSPFQRALAAQLTTSLVNDGYVVSRNAAGSLKVELDVQTLTFSADRPQYRYYGEKTVLAGGIVVLSALDAGFAFNAGTALAAVDGHQWLNSQFAPGETPKTEIIVTVSVSDQYRYLARNTSAYYVADTDRVLYGIIDPQPEEPKITRTFQVRGDI